MNSLNAQVFINFARRKAVARVSMVQSYLLNSSAIAIPAAVPVQDGSNHAPPEDAIAEQGTHLTEAIRDGSDQLGVEQPSSTAHDTVVQIALEDLNEDDHAHTAGTPPPNIPPPEKSADDIVMVTSV